MSEHEHRFDENDEYFSIHCVVCGASRKTIAQIKRYKQALEDAPDISNCNTLGYVKWYNSARAKALNKER